MTAPLPAGMAMAPALPAELVVVADRPPQGETGRRRKVAYRATRGGRAAAAHDCTAAVTAIARPPQPSPLDVSSRDLARDGEG